MAPAVRAKILGGSTIDDTDVAEIVRASMAVRGAFVVFFLSNGTQWFTADFPASELGGVRVLRCHVAFSPNRTFAEFAQAKQELGPPRFDLSVTRGRPILVGPTVNGPWCLMEGNHRCCSILRGNADGTNPISSIPVIAGICARAQEWYWWT